MASISHAGVATLFPISPHFNLDNSKDISLRLSSPWCLNAYNDAEAAKRPEKPGAKTGYRLRNLKDGETRIERDGIGVPQSLPALNR